MSGLKKVEEDVPKSMEFLGSSSQLRYVKTELWKNGGSHQCQYATTRATLKGPTEKKEGTTKTPMSREVALSLEAIRQRAKGRLFAMCVGVGLDTLELMFVKKLEERICKKGKHNAKRTGSRHSHEPRKVVLGERKVEVSKPRAHTVDGKGVTLETYEVLKNDEILMRYPFEGSIDG